MTKDVLIFIIFTKMWNDGPLQNAIPAVFILSLTLEWELWRNHTIKNNIINCFKICAWYTTMVKTVDIWHVFGFLWYNYDVVYILNGCAVMCQICAHLTIASATSPLRGSGLLVGLVIVQNHKSIHVFVVIY